MDKVTEELKKKRGSESLMEKHEKERRKKEKKEAKKRKNEPKVDNINKYLFYAFLYIFLLEYKVFTQSFKECFLTLSVNTYVSIY